MRRATILAVVVFIVSAMLAPAALYAADATPSATPVPPTPPSQPAAGPGGADYAYDEVVATAYGEPVTTIYGEYSPAFWLFEPAGPSDGTEPVEQPLPLVVFVQGTCIGCPPVEPEFVRSWIDHIVRRGAVVAYPLNRALLLDVELGTGAALAELATGDHIAFDPAKVTVIGYSNGGPLAASLAAKPPSGLPQPAALLLVASVCCMPDDFGKIPTATRVVMVAFEHDRAVPASESGQNWEALTAIPAASRAFVTLPSDAHGSPPLDADHFTGFTNGALYGGIGRVDALDWYGTWKLLDGLMACTFTGELCEYAFGNTPEQRYMGTWSDGVPVNEAMVATSSATSVAAAMEMHSK